MIGRCHDERTDSYEYYGGRGIKVCDRWMDPDKGYENFVADMGERPSQSHQIDRIDGDGHYHPDNCRWVTSQENTWNRRGTCWLEFQGERLPRSEWHRRLGFSPYGRGLSMRLEAGWPPEEAFTKPSARAHADPQEEPLP